MEDKDIKKMTKKELMQLENFIKEDTKFNAIVIVPMPYKHESGYQCMKYVLLNNWKIVGVVGGSSDVVHINGIGGYGKEPNYTTRMVEVHDLRIDCLPGSKCLRLFSNSIMEVDKYFISDFIFYFKDK